MLSSLGARSVAVALVGLATLVALPSCSSSGTCAGEDDVAACLDDMYFSAPKEAAPLPDCANASGKAAPFSPPKTQKLVLFRGDGIDEDDVAHETRLAQSYYRAYGLGFVTDKDAAPYEIEFALGGTKEELETAGRIGAGPNARAEATRRVADVMLGPMRSFIRAHRNPGTVQVVVLESIASPAVEELNGSSIFAGIGVSPALLDDLEGSGSLTQLLALGADFTPTLFLGHTDIVERSVGPTIVAHELGHSLGLQHTKVPGNLMTQGQGDEQCLPFLDAGQLDRIGKNAGGVATKGIASELREIEERIVAKVNHLD